MRETDDAYPSGIRRRLIATFTIIPALIIGLSGCSNKVVENEGGLPGKLADMHLERVIQGDEAAQVIHKMHGKNLGASDNLIGHYGSKADKNTLYLSGYDNKEAAKTDLMNMAMKMQGGTKVFEPLTVIGKMGDSVVFRTEGMGLTHYFYRVENRLIWWQVEPGKAESTYDELVAYDFAMTDRGTIESK